MFYDAALHYDPATRKCDCAIGDDGDLLIDTTAITPVLMSVGLDRRADINDELPIGRSAFLADASYSDRRGAPTDALDGNGELSGCKCWLFERAKETETTRQLYEFWLAEGLDWVAAELDRAPEIEVVWLRPETLGWRVFVEEDEVSGSAILYSSVQ